MKKILSTPVLRALLAGLSLAVLGAGCSRPDDAARTSPQAARTESAQRAPTSGAPEPDYLRAVHDPIHFKPAIDSARNEQCLACHAEVLAPSVRDKSPAGVAASQVTAWYQRTSTYQGAQDTFHRRHIETPLAKKLMSLDCNGCHQGHDPRDEAPGSSATATGQAHALRKQVDPEATCLKCHGRMNWQAMGLPAPWPESGKTFQDNCLLCHAGIRTVRHQVSYLKADAIEEAGKADPQACYGCHGGRAWYRTVYPYPRHAWPGMPDATPDWAKGRPTESEARFAASAARPGSR